MNIIHDKFKVHSLTGRITPELMIKAFKAVKKNRGAAGIDRISIETFEKNLSTYLPSLMIDLKKGLYQPLPLRRVHIPKGIGKKETRPLGIPPIRCRVAQEVARQLINPTFEAVFHNNSYGFRPGRNCHQAIEGVLEYLQQGYKFVVDADIKGFFDNIQHDLIMESVSAKIADRNILKLIEKFLRSGVMENGKLSPTTRGTCQGGVISPLLANLVLNHFDWHMHKQGINFIRYADDFVLLCKTQQEAEKALEIAKDFLEKELLLILHPEKTKIVHLSEGFNFLGFFITDKGITMRDKSKEKFTTKIKQLTIRSHNLDQEVIKKINQVVRGTVNYFYTSFSTVKTQFTILDGFIRRRLRCMKYKRFSITDNHRLHNKHLKRMGLLNCMELGKARFVSS